jgi:hypothetical protein
MLGLNVVIWCVVHYCVVWYDCNYGHATKVWYSSGIVMYHNGIVFGIIITGIDEMVRYGEMMYGMVWYICKQTILHFPC